MSHQSSIFDARLVNATASERYKSLGRTVGGVVIAMLFMGSTLLTPLYDLYRSTYGLSVVGAGLLYAVYVVGNLAALLFLGRLSDQIGRRPVVLGSLTLAFVSALLFAMAHGTGELFLARIVNGLAVGLGSGAATAWITDFTEATQRARSASVMTTFNFGGLALGSIIAGLLVQFGPHPLQLSFVVYLVMLAVTTICAARLSETVRSARNTKVDLKPRIGVPAGKRLAFIAPATGGFAAMALVGFFAALGPTTIERSLHITNRAVSGAVVASLFVIAALAIFLTINTKARTTMMLGHLAIPAGVALLICAQRFQSLWLMVASASVCGISSALGYRGGLAVVNSLADPERRAEVASTYFVCCFLGNALPIIGVTALTQMLGAERASLIFAVVLSVIGLGALAVARLVHVDSEQTAPP